MLFDGAIVHHHGLVCLLRRRNHRLERSASDRPDGLDRLAVCRPHAGADLYRLSWHPVRLRTVVLLQIQHPGTGSTEINSTLKISSVSNAAPTTLQGTS